MYIDMYSYMYPNNKSHTWKDIINAQVILLLLLLLLLIPEMQ